MQPYFFQVCCHFADRCCLLICLLRILITHFCTPLSLTLPCRWRILWFWPPPVDGWRVCPVNRKRGKQRIIRGLQGFADSDYESLFNFCCPRNMHRRSSKKMHLEFHPSLFELCAPNDLRREVPPWRAHDSLFKKKKKKHTHNQKVTKMFKVKNEIILWFTESFFQSKEGG